MARKTLDYQCADCFNNVGDNGRGCYCSEKRKYISICDNKCKDFVLNPDLEDYIEFDPGKFIYDEMSANP